MTMPAHFFWEVATAPQSVLLQPPTTRVQTDPKFDHSTTKIFLVPQYGQIDHISARVRIRPFELAVLKDLIASGDLDPGVLPQIKTFDIGQTVRHWFKANVDPVTLCDQSPYE
jgi:hypothetical protein